MIKQKNYRPSHVDRSPGNENRHSGIRRRGQALEDAILQATWDELNEVGYAHLTMERVAARAKTNKASLYRRWPSKAKIVMAAVSKNLPVFSNLVPDTGDLRNDVLTLLHRIAKPLETIGAETIHGLMVEYLGKELISSIPQIMRKVKESKFETIMAAILKNAEKRGEVNLGKIRPRVISLPADLLRYELLTTHEPISETTIIEIVDDIFIPLIHSYL
jgi:AcrR family transcriptional regulator